MQARACNASHKPGRPHEERGAANPLHLGTAKRHIHWTMNANSLLSTKRWTLAVVCAATAMLMLDIAVVNTALSRIADDLDTGLSGLQWVVDAYTLALASTVLTAGSLADRLRRPPLFTFGPAPFTRAPPPRGPAQNNEMPHNPPARPGPRAARVFA